jgi:hypothetical protein
MHNYKFVLKFSLLLIFTLSIFRLPAQDSLQVSTSFWTGTKFQINGERASKKAFLKTISSNKAAYDLASRGSSQQNSSVLLSAIGGGLIGWPIGAALGGNKDPGWILAGIGAGVIAIAVPIYKGGSKKIHRAVGIFNEGATGLEEGKGRPVVSLAARGAAIGLVVTAPR